MAFQARGRMWASAVAVLMLSACSVVQPTAIDEQTLQERAAQT